MPTREFSYTTTSERFQGSATDPPNYSYTPPTDETMSITHNPYSYCQDDSNDYCSGCDDSENDPSEDKYTDDWHMSEGHP